MKILCNSFSSWAASLKAVTKPKNKENNSQHMAAAKHRHLLCDACIVIFRGLKYPLGPGTRVTEHLGSVEQLHEGIKIGCAICDRLARHLASKLVRLQNIEQLRSTYDLNDYDRPGKIKFVMYWGAQNNEVYQLTTNLNRLCRQINSSFDSAATFQLIQGWLRNCLDGHQQCYQRWKNAQEFQLPTRLVDTGQSGSKECRVVRTDSGSISGAYLTLSHRWGQSPFLQLNSHTIGNLTTGIPIAELPATFRDTVSIAHQLGIRYLWIDSLCIQQDSKEDWIRESPTMSHVYGFATINIVAGHAHGPEGGLFSTREFPYFGYFTVRSAWDSRWESNADYLLWDKVALEDDFEFAPLTQRGWVFQERLMAPRMLQFGKEQVYWRCSKLFASETWPQGALSREGKSLRFGTDLDDLDGDDTMEVQPLGELGDSCTEALSRGPIAKWERLVSEYSRTELTRPEDKLVALSGVAKLFQQTFKDRYLAGLWWSSLPRLLCWRRDIKKEQEPRVRPKYRAPSWSWASVDGPITFTTTNMEHPSMTNPLRIEYLITGVDGKIDPLDGDEMAQVKGGAIT
ncbi:hypothetical protein CDV36_004546 [Fusarium kuroshium]|uniref:Heterokaryon incompatibility domain-containing protein n=1 Tax=Fusarium kuroshium TaxID=2010991 RepID=A0A3M2SE00_9HYPO|nr:hypothetical protein CDV36_004546 [Fusarium kuroshium]